MEEHLEALEEQKQELRKEQNTWSVEVRRWNQQFLLSPLQDSATESKALSATTEGRYACNKVEDAIHTLVTTDQEILMLQKQCKNAKDQALNFFKEWNRIQQGRGGIAIEVPKGGLKASGIVSTILATAFNHLNKIALNPKIPLILESTIKINSTQRG